MDKTACCYLGANLLLLLLLLLLLRRRDALEWGK